MKKSKIIMLVGMILMAGIYFFPLWNITLEAPQYPEPIGMNIHINRIADMNPNDVKNINIMNHYIGMQDIPESIPEFKVFPFVLVGMIVLGLIAFLNGDYRLFLGWFILMAILGIIGMYDFYLWEYDYGHNLKQNAAIKFTNPDGSPLAYQPPLWGSKTILNFIAHSYPRLGAYLLFSGMGCALTAFFVGRKEKNS